MRATLDAACGSHRSQQPVFAITSNVESEKMPIPPLERPGKGKIQSRRGTRGKKRLFTEYCQSLTSRKALSFACILTPQSRSETGCPMEGGRRTRVRGNTTQRTPHPPSLDFWVSLLRAPARVSLHTAALAFGAIWHCIAVCRVS